MSSLPNAAGALPWLVTVCCALSAALGCNTERAKVVSRYHLSGRVADAGSGHGVGGARVIFTSDTLDSISTRTGDAGRYELDAVAAAGVELGTLTVEHPGYRAPTPVSVYFDGTERSVDFELQPLPAGGQAGGQAGGGG
ncbi:MAG: carboxypeptidase-like regulatory domain-containing protein [Myxococcales bacterium]